MRKLQEKKGSGGGFSGFKSGEGEFAENTLTCRFCTCLICSTIFISILFLSFRRITVYLICSPRAGTPLWDGAILRHSNPTKFSKVIMTDKNVLEGELNKQIHYRLSRFARRFYCVCSRSQTGFLRINEKFRL